MTKLYPQIYQLWLYVQDRTVTTLKDIVKLEVSDDTAVGPQYGIAKLFLKQQVRHFLVKGIVGKVLWENLKLSVSAMIHNGIV